MHIFVIPILAQLFLTSYGVDYIEAYYEQDIDHFNFQNNDTFKQRYLYNDTWWDRGQGPIFFYAGNESPITKFWEFSGFVTEIAPQFKALVLFIEHRYYGKSLPFGEESLTAPNIGFLSIEQAVADFAFLLEDFKKDFQAETSPVIAFGGSYGGELAAFMRFKFPNIVLGAIASSAPFYLTSGIIPGAPFYQIATDNFRNESRECENRVRSAFKQIDKWASLGLPGYTKISMEFRLCQFMLSSGDYDRFLRWLRQSFTTAAQINYPFNYTTAFPPFPVKEMCERILQEDSPVAGMKSAISVSVSKEDNGCYDIYKGFLSCTYNIKAKMTPSEKAWDYQTCTEVISVEESNGVTDMFPVLPCDFNVRSDYCRRAWNVTPRKGWKKTLFWGGDVSSASNIVYSNGELDPWRAGGETRNFSENAVSILIEDAAHQLDLWERHSADPQSAIAARSFETEMIEKWLEKS